MEAMILAAGKGTRVRPITNLVPKPMIPLIGKPIMQSIVEHLRDCGIDQIVVNASQLAPMIEDYFRDGSSFGVENVPKEEVFRYGVVATGPDGRVVCFQEKPKIEDAVSTTINTGIYIFEPAFFDYIPKSQPFDIGSELFPRLVADGAPM